MTKEFQPNVQVSLEDIEKEERPPLSKQELANQTLIIPERLGERIKELRTELGYSQAKIAGDFMSIRTLQKIEKGETTPTFEVLLHIANMLKIEMFDLVLSSRMPFYLEEEFPDLLRNFLHSIESEDSVNEIKMRHFTTLLKEFNQIKLPYDEQQRLETVYAILHGFTHRHKDAALQLLSDLLGNFFDELKANPMLPATEHRIFLLSAYVRLQQNQKVFDALLQTLHAFPDYLYNHTLAYNFGLALYKDKNWEQLEQLMEQTLAHTGNITDYTLLPMLYCQLGIARFHLEKGNGVFLFDKGLELLLLFRQEEHYNLMRVQAKNDGLPIEHGAYKDILND